MKKDELSYIIRDYCTRHEIEITDEMLEEALYAIKQRIDAQEEYNYRCGIHSVDVDVILDSYFEV